MTLFNEIYGAYFRIAAAVLERDSVTAGDIRTIVEGEGFRDSVLFVPDKLLQGEGSWGLLEDNGDGSFSRVTDRPPVTVVTELQKRWLKAKLLDPKMRLFLSDEEISGLSERLRDTEPLYTPEQLRTVDAYSDGDDISSPEYRTFFRELLTAVKNREICYIAFTSGKNEEIGRLFLPMKMEYSVKNDKFRVYCRSMKKGRAHGSSVINIGRITEVRRTGSIYQDEENMEEYFSSLRCREPVVVKVTGERNGVERFMMEFSSYEKRTEFDMETGTCQVTLWYDRGDETEMLIRLLSFGPVLEIIAPQSLRQQAAVRIRSQYRLLGGK